MKTTNAKPRVNFDGQEYVVRSGKVAIPDFSTMHRIDALQWLNRYTFARGYSKGNPLAGLGNVLKVN